MTALNENFPTPAHLGLVADKPSVAHVAVTPEIAARWLAENRVNRRLRAGRVEQYANDMAAGRWSLSNDAICLSPNGVLLNGQHRLAAIVKSGVTTMMLVARNMPEQSMTTMDSGSARTAADALAFAGETNTACLAAAGKLALLHEDGGIYKDRRSQARSHRQIMDFVAENPLLRHSVVTAIGAGRKVEAPPSPLATAHWLIARTVGGVGLPDLFLEKLATRANEPTGSAILALDSRLRELRRNRAALEPRFYLYLFIKGWNYWANGKPVTQLNVVPKGEFRIPAPTQWGRPM